MKGSINIGTSGWSYKHWKGLFYPPEVKETDWLPYYSHSFNIAEINTSFYHLPKHQTVLNWLEKVPENFLFCPKLSRYVTHMKKLKDVEEPMQRFFDVFAPMHAQMGPVLVQLPPQLKWDYERAESFYSLLQKEYKTFEFVIEIRHDSWLQSDSLTQMAKYNAGIVISQSGGVFPYTEMVTAKNIYLRFHGPRELYASGYSNEELAYYAQKIKVWEEQGHAIWAFFNNDIHGYAFADAQRLLQMCGH